MYIGKSPFSVSMSPLLLLPSPHPSLTKGCQVTGILILWFLSNLLYHPVLHFVHSSAQSLSHVGLFASPWTAVCQASLSITISWNLLKLMSIKLVMPSNHLILCHPFLLPPSIFPRMRSFPTSQFFASGGQSIGVSASASVLPMNTQEWSPLGCTAWISLQSKGLSRLFSNTTVEKHPFLWAQLSSQSKFHVHT